MMNISQVGESMNVVTDSREFRKTLGQYPTGVTVITALDRQGRRMGMTANSFASVSLEPMLVLWSIAKSSNNFDAWINASHFAIHVLHAGQEPLSRLFSSSCEDRFQGMECCEGAGGVPLLNDFSAVFQCSMETQYEGGDHVILIGRVLSFENRLKAPLVFHAGRYADLELPVAV
jgi:flavin reductase (DIM6/NTAB) family NADH-FMN oxidoreductase RutF